MDAQPQTYPEFNARVCKILGIVQLVLGCFAILIEIINIILYASNSQGFWGGIWMIIAGALGMAASGRKTKGLVVACGVLSIIAAVLAFIAMIVAFLLAGAASAYANLAGWVALEAVSGIIFLAEIVIGIMSAVICLRPVCCPGQGVTATSHTTTTTTVTY